MSSVVRDIIKDVVKSVKPPEKLSLPDWADKYRKIPDGSSPEPGNFRTDRTPYMRKPMEDISDDEVEKVVLMLSAQLGKTEMEINICGYLAHMDPCSMMYLMPTLETAEKISKDRLAPTIDCSPVLKRLFGQNKSRSTSSTIRSKKFPGGTIYLNGANSPSSLSSSPMRALLADEVDRYELSAGSEGDPLSLAMERTKNFWNRIIVIVSTPTNEGSSKIDSEFQLSNKHHRELPCPHCGEYQELLFKNFKWVKDDLYIPPWFECVSCGEKMEEKHKREMSLNGIWVSETPDRGKQSMGYRLNEFHSPFSKWADIRKKFLAAKGSLEKMRVFTNTTLGEVFTDVQTLNDSEVVKARREHYADCPEDVLVVVAGVDTQDDALHYEIVGVGEDHQTWGLEYGVLRGDPGKPELWNKLHEKLSRTFERPDGVVMNVMKTCIDSGGHHTTDVYKFCKKFLGRYHPIVGRAGKGKPIINRGNKLKDHKNVVLYTVGVDSCKELFLVSRIKQTDVTWGYCHYPFGRGYDDQYFNELTNVRVEDKKVQGNIERVFVDHGRVEAVDCRVYSMAALEVLNPSFHAIKANINALVRKKDTVPKTVQKKKTTKRKVAKPKNNRKAKKNMQKLRGK
jgi:phage terminase large subunit GpA-like protein